MTSPPAIDVIRRPDPAASLLDETRQLLLTQLAQPDSAAGLARRLGLPRQRINYHLKVMESQGLVELVEERRKGNCVERVVRATARSFMISPQALGALGDSADAARDRYSSAYLIAAAGRLRLHDHGAGRTDPSGQRRAGSASALAHRDHPRARDRLAASGVLESAGREVWRVDLAGYVHP